MNFKIVSVVATPNGRPERSQLLEHMLQEQNSVKYFFLTNKTVYAESS